jgi:hypothetical protein
MFSEHPSLGLFKASLEPMQMAGGPTNATSMWHLTNILWKESSTGVTDSRAVSRPHTTDWHTFFL